MNFPQNFQNLASFTSHLKSCEPLQMLIIILLSLFAFLSPFFIIFNRSGSGSKVGQTQVKFKFKTSNQNFPRIQKMGDAGIDLPVLRNVTINPGEIKSIDTGIAADIPEDKFLLIKERSSVALKGVYVMGGIIDSGFTGTIRLILRNCGPGAIHFYPGMCPAQAIPLPRLNTGAIFVREGKEETIVERTFRPPPRGDSGFGSTDAGLEYY